MPMRNGYERHTKAMTRAYWQRAKSKESNMVAVKAPSLTEVYKAICQALKSDPAKTVMVVNHIGAKHGIHNIPAFHTSDAISEKDKLETYGEIVRVLAGKEPATALRGAVAAGQAEVKPEQPAPPPSRTVPASTTSAPDPDDDDDDRIRTVMEDPAPPPAFDPVDLTKRRDAVIPLPTDRPTAADPMIEQLREVLRKVVGQPEAKLDEARVKAIAETAATDAAAAAVKESEERASKAIADAIAAIKPTAVTHQFNVGGEVRPVAGTIHRQLPQIVAWLTADTPVWLWGQAGGGKTHLARQCAEALGLPFYCVPVDETITVGKLMGFRNVSNGEFVEGLMYRAYKFGGVLLMDEIDTNATTIASANSLVANGHYTFPNGEEVTRHKDFRLIAGANTKGTGAVAGYTARVRMDAATLDRFAVIKLEYDPGLELAITCGVPSTSEPWKCGEPASADLCRNYVEWVQKVRGKVGESVLISPRASHLGVRALRVGVPAAEVAEALVFKLVTEDTRRRILSEVGAIPTS